MTYLKGWTGSLPLCPLIFSWVESTNNFCRSQLKRKKAIAAGHGYVKPHTGKYTFEIVESSKLQKS